MNGSASKEDQNDQKSDEVKEADDEYSDDEMTDEESSEEEDDDDDEYINIDVNELRGNLTCKLCEGIIKHTKAIKNCLHRFCGACIDKWFNDGNKECPVCGSDCPNQHASLGDGIYDKIIAAFFPQ
ncbi:E3 ubiquitin-protein ligase RING1a [Artemisia annua]|uniref:E3 ubiquitin-protein ligase RING1a n=1 Tax=Artemisia annua TaxID=35608 RepID=A0A2U1NL68_ARTAN|nr:E3 ubiquitin-protein ligase RING1a [Artemisia annua]